MLRLLAFALFSLTVTACQRDWDSLQKRIHQHRSPHVKRAEVDYPPTLSEIETILANSFDNRSLSDWSYYYTHGDHLGSHNKSMAEWTAEKWREAGLDSYLAEYLIYGV